MLCDLNRQFDTQPLELSTVCKLESYCLIFLDFLSTVPSKIKQADPLIISHVSCTRKYFHIRRTVLFNIALDKVIWFKKNVK